MKQLTHHYYSLGLVAVVSLSFGLRFWQLARFNALVFDEVYFAKFAQSYLAGTPQFDAHPPLGKYFIAVGIWLSTHIPFAGGIDWQTTVEPETGLSPLSYRWMNALVGSCIPGVVMAIAHTLYRRQGAQRQTFVLLAGFFVAIDGLFITESRYALLNVYMVFLGLLGHWLWLRAGVQEEADEPVKGTVYRVLAGVALGGAIAVKWNGLGYVLSLLIWEALTRKIWQADARTLTRSLLAGLIYGGLIPALTYSLIWWPHLQLTGESLRGVHSSLISFHRQLAALGHPACSRWYTWPLLIKPIAYWYETAGSQAYTVNNLGNPALWWLSGSATVLLFCQEAWCVSVSIRHRLTARLISSSARFGTSRLNPYLLIGYAANWLPWILVGRCTFIYLYMPGVVFSFMTLAWWLSGWLHSPAEGELSRTMGLAFMGVIILAALFWLPLSLGSPLSLESLQLRWWLKSWI